MAAKEVVSAGAGNVMEPAATGKAADPRGRDEGAAGKGGVLAELKAVGNKGREDGVTDEGAVPGADLKVAMATPPRGESTAVEHAVLGRRRIGLVNFFTFEGRVGRDLEETK